MNKILVTGGTGTLGQEIVRQLLQKGFKPNVLSSRGTDIFPPSVNVYEGDLTVQLNIRDIVRDAEIIIHCASNPRNSKIVDVVGTGNLLKATDPKRLKHLVYLSIAGVDKSTYPYYRDKHRVEDMIRTSGLPWSIVRPTQFHDLVLNRVIRPNDSGSYLRLPKEMRFQSIDVREVAGYVIDLVMKGSNGAIATIAGPEILSVEQMAQTYLEILDRRKDTIEWYEAESDFLKLFETGINLYPSYTYGQVTWKEFLSKELTHMFTK